MHEVRGWPETYGFRIHGEGPAYVIAVERGGVAHTAGLKPGDMLLEVDGHNVTDMSAESIKTLAGHSRSVPPTLGVVSRVKAIALIANKKWGYGFTVKGRQHVEVGSVDPPGPAYQAGLRPGDVILKVNGVHVNNDGLVTHVLQARVGRLKLSVIPIDAPGSFSYLKETQDGTHGMNGTYMEGMGPARRAKELCNKLDMVLGHSYDKKMAAIGLLKQYAEDRDIDGLVDALSGLLKTDQERSLVPALKLLVPVQHKSCFDHLVNAVESEVSFDQVGRSVSNNSSSITGDASAGKYTTESRFVKVKRGKGSFGFILKGHSPVTVESTVPAGPADRAGIMPGDAVVGLNGLDVRSFTHGKMVDLLRGSGSSPTLEILRMERDSAISMTNSDSIPYTSETDSLYKPSDTQTDPSSLDQKGGESLSEYVHLLLSPKEALATSTALQVYKRNGRISELMTSLKRILDTPSKRTLWYHIIARLPWHHRVQVLKVAEALGLQPKELQKHVQGRRRPHHVTNDATDADVTNTNVGSFKKQLDYLLTSSERSQLKRSLEEYIRSKDVHHLVHSLQQFLDTPSKRTLFFYIIPLLNSKHQSTCQKILRLPKHYTEQGRKEQNQRRHKDKAKWQLSSPSHRLQTVLSDESERESSLSSDENDVSFSKRDTLPLRDARSPGFLLGPRNLDRHINLHSAEIHRDGHEEPINQGGTPEKRRVHIVRESASQTTPVTTPVRKPIANYKTVIQVLESPSFSPSRQPRPLLHGHGRLHGLNVSRPYHGGTSPNTDHAKISPNANHAHSPNISHTYDQGSEYYVENVKLGPSNHHPSGSQHLTANHHISGSHSDMLLQYKQASGSYQQSNVDATGIKGKLIQWPPTRTKPNGVSSADSGQSRNSDDTSLDSFQRKALNAINALDEVVAKEQALPSSHIDNYLDEDNDAHIGWKGGGAISKQSLSPNVMVPSPPPPPPPPVLAQIPPAPPLPLPSKRTSLTDSVKMHVKRINWEKLDEVPEDTVWAKFAIGEELRELVEHLQLERQFTTKRSKIADTFTDRKAEMGILSPKKAYNISILLGHMKIPVKEIRSALLAVDDVIMTSDLLRQLLTFAPDDKEMVAYNNYTGSLDDLNKPDQFMYQVTRVPNFHARLKSMLFKASFHEKMYEIKRRLDTLLQASEELQRSKSLSKLLELVLAMGNQMNKGDSRVGSAAGFRVSYLTQLDMMKTSSGKENFMNVLAGVVHTRFPSAIRVATELPTLPGAVRDAEISPDEELKDVKRMLGDIQEALNEVPEKAGSKETDKLPTVMSSFLAGASDEIDSLTEIHIDKLNRCRQMVRYFGEDPNRLSLQDIFSTFLQFIHKLEKAYQQNLLVKKT